MPPAIDQVIIEDNRLELELSEEIQVDEGKIRINITPAPLVLRTPTVKATDVPKTVEVPVQNGRRARQRIVITPATPPALADVVDIVIDSDGIQDSFLNPLAAQYTRTVTWPDSANGVTVVVDETLPEVDELRLRDGHLEVSFSEPPDLAQASASVQVDGQTLTWVAVRMVIRFGLRLRSLKGHIRFESIPVIRSIVMERGWQRLLRRRLRS